MFSLAEPLVGVWLSLNGLSLSLARVLPVRADPAIVHRGDHIVPGTDRVAP
ncbi:hypothetical protein GCM10010478_39050 [Streptomyces erythrogriseus]|uniref:Uncharacterized protein n=3 Tax=Streptomyces TaxID=1883 RepID=A0ABP6JI34_9ACTN|nr:hypothetical protein GCM10010265_06580 [Streptomyces griseoincarnatus]GGT79824.1 hypothetical protein GCM10010287_62710 [Streptomyces variabilis]